MYEVGYEIRTNIADSFLLARRGYFGVLHVASNGEGVALPGEALAERQESDLMASAKEHGINISLSTVATLIPVLALVWFFVQPALVSSVSTAVAGEFDDQIRQQTAPIQGAFKVIIKGDIDKIKRMIARLEYEEEHHAEDWSADDADHLADLKIELEALEDADKEL